LLLVKAIIEIESAKSSKDKVEENEFKDINKIILPLLQFASVLKVVVSKEILLSINSNIYKEGSISIC
jgi:hypothetical protein